MQSLVNELFDSFQYLNEVIIMSKVISVASQKVLVDVLTTVDKLENKWVAVTDSLMADGITSFDLESTKTGENDKLRAQVKSIIVSTFRKADQDLLAKDSKTLEAAQKIERKALIQKVGARLSLIESKLRKAESDTDDGSGAQESSKSEVQKIQAKLDEVLSKLNKLENPQFDVVETVKLVKTVKGMIPTV
jgi:hypothetical protein